MNVFDSLKITSSALTAQRIRMNVISSNLANIETTRTPEGGPYRKQEVVFQTTTPSFADNLQGAIQGVEVAKIETSNAPPRMVYDPSNPDANAKGYVAMPNINLVGEMTDLMTATKAYEANVTAAQAAKKMALKALEIGQ